MPITNANGYSHGNINTNCYGYGYLYANGYRDCHCYGYCNRYSHSNGCTYRNANAYAVRMARNGLLSAGGHE